LPISGRTGAGPDLNKQQEVAKFFRNTLNPLLAEFGCAAFVVHHIAKPSKVQKSWEKSDLNYLGAGSADLANWSRETIVLREVGDGLFEMAMNKRWRPLGWTDDEGKPCRERPAAAGSLPRWPPWSSSGLVDEDRPFP
jgi:hypothetical protein